MNRIEKECRRLAREMQYDVDDKTMAKLVAKTQEQFPEPDGPGPDPREIDIAFLGAYLPRADASCATREAAQVLLHHTDFEKLDGEADWIPFERLLEALRPPLLEVHFVDRCIAALRILGWPYAAIGSQSEQALPNISLGQLDAMRFEAFHDQFRQFRSRLCDSLCSRRDKHVEWLRELLVHEGNWRLTGAAAEVFGQFLERPKDGPHMRGADAMLRDRWKGIKAQPFLSQVAQSTFFGNGIGK